MKLLSAFVFLAIGLTLPFAVHSQDAGLRCPTNVNNTATITYYDGNNNTYVLSDGKIEYTPATADQSSSGTYNGGKHKKAKLNQKDWSSIAELLNLVIDNTGIHMQNRIMTSVMIQIKEGTAFQQWIITPKALQIKEIEEALKNALN